MAKQKKSTFQRLSSGAMNRQQRRIWGGVWLVTILA
jgi:hypothetical protein